MKKNNILLIVIIIIIGLIILSIWFMNKNEAVDVYKRNQVSTENNNQYTFELMYENNGNDKLAVVITKGEIANYDYNIYVYDGEIKIKVDNEEVYLRNALLNNKINMSDIIEKCMKDVEDNTITSDMYMDGGTIIYKYNSYWIIRENKLEGQKDVYITKPNINYSDLTKKDIQK